MSVSQELLRSFNSRKALTVLCGVLDRDTIEDHEVNPGRIQHSVMDQAMVNGVFDTLFLVLIEFKRHLYFNLEVV